MSTFNKRSLTVDTRGKQRMAKCLHCKKHEVPIEDWNKRCKFCKEKQDRQDAIEKQQIEMGVGKRLPAAVIEIEDGDGNVTGEKVFVDKFGREVENPGYDLDNDPRGWGYTKGTSKGTTII